MRGEASGALNVPMNRAVVVESQTPFAELSIANPGIADISTLSDRTIYVLGKAPGRTTLTLLGPDGRLITNVEVQVTPDVAEFKERLQQILPNERIEVRTANDGIVLSGTVSSIQKLDRALDLAQRYAPDRVSNLIMVGGEQQVMLKVRFAEMQRSVAKGLSGGILGSWSNGNSGIEFGAGSGRLQPGPIGDGGNILSLDPDGIGAIAIGGVIGDLALRASRGAREQGCRPHAGRTEPHRAERAGSQLPRRRRVPHPGRRTTEGEVTIEYKPFGVELSFTPRVVDGDIINLELVAAVSGLDPTVVVQNAGFSINGFRRRETRTTVEMRDGESFAIAGLLEDDFRDLVGQVPWVGDIPILGTLFRSAEYERGSRSSSSS
jgi:pilus assembly protein CpaC